MSIKNPPSHAGSLISNRENTSDFSGSMRGTQAQITLTLPPALLKKVNTAAAKLSLTRAAFLKLAISRAVEAEKV